MAVNSRFMLPLKVLKMAQSGELLEAEHAELELLRERILHEKNQLYLHSCDDALPRLERIYGLPVNSGDSLDARRRRLLAKHNAREVCTPETLRETVLIITGNTSDIVEHYSEGYFSVVVHMPLRDATAYLRELIAQISEQRPAHLLFETVAAFETIPCFNRQNPHLYSVDFHARVENLGIEFPRFNGWNRFGREIRFGGRVTKGLRFRQLEFQLSGKNPWSSAQSTAFFLKGRNWNNQTARFGIKAQAVNREAVIPRSFSIQAACRNRNDVTAALTKDSRWNFGQEYKFNGVRRFNGAGYTKEDL